MGARYRQFCALARAAEILGERWTLLIVRELLLGGKRFTDLRAALDGVSPSVLARRLGALEMAGLVRRTELEPPAASTVYELTPDGRAVRSAVFELIRWGGRFLFPRRRGDRFDPHWLLLALSACARKKESPPHSLQVRIPTGRKEVSIHIAGGPEGTSVELRSATAEATIVSDGVTLLGLMGGRVNPVEAFQAGRIRVEGAFEVATLMPQFFETSSNHTTK